MNQEEIRKEIAEIGTELKLFDLIVHAREDGSFVLNDRQGKAVERLLKMFRVLGWELNFANYKSLVHADTKPLRPGIWGSGIPVKLRSCKKEHGDKTYFGILLGDMALQIHHSISGETLTASHAFYNPAIYVPELREVVYGCESWWEKVETEEALKSLITDEVIENVWYMKLLKTMNKAKEEPPTPPSDNADRKARMDAVVEFAKKQGFKKAELLFWDPDDGEVGHLEPDDALQDYDPGVRELSIGIQLHADLKYTIHEEESGMGEFDRVSLAP